jgi:hypothetical protein
MRRAAANYPGEAMYDPIDYDRESYPTPMCCGGPMRLLAYEQTVAAARLSEADRVQWIAAGGKVTKRGGVRRWKAIW